MATKLPEMIISATAKDGRLIFKNHEDIYAYCIEHDGEDITLHLECEVKKLSKLGMYAFWYVNILECAVIGYLNAGYECPDKVTADYRLRAELAKDFLKNPDGSYQVIMLDKRNMTKARLHKLLSDAIFFIENNLNVRVPESSEYKIKASTGRNFLKNKE
jgi:hypothetical protein